MGALILRIIKLNYMYAFTFFFEKLRTVRQKPHSILLKKGELEVQKNIQKGRRGQKNLPIYITRGVRRST
jgi:hypothetical protein